MQPLTADAMTTATNNRKTRFTSSPPLRHVPMEHMSREPSTGHALEAAGPPPASNPLWQIKIYFGVAVATVIGLARRTASGSYRTPWSLGVICRLAAEEDQQVSVDNVGVGRGHAVWQAGIRLQRAMLQQLP